MDFGLGLVLSFTDNASAGINNAVNSLNSLTETANGAASSLDKMASLSALSVVSNQMGSSVSSMGQRLIGTFGNILGHVQETGSEFESFRLTLNKLFGDEQKASDAMGKLLDFSIKSPFEVNEVKDMLVVLKSQGIDAFEELEGASSGFRQENLSWIADLMAFKPDEAVSRWKRAFTNYLGSGQKLVLQNTLDMGDIENDVLGHDMGTNAQERMRDLMEIVEKVNLQGYASELSSTMSGMASNVDDAMTKLYKSIADTGVYDALKQSFASLRGVMLGLSDEEIAAIGTTIGEAFKIILKPVTMAASAVDKLLHTVVSFAQTNPTILKWGMVFTAASGALLIFTGVALKAISAFSGLALVQYTVAQQFGSISNLFRVGSLRIISALLPLTITLGILYSVWKNDLGGIQTTVKTFTGNVITSFERARAGVTGSLQGLNYAIRAYDDGSFFGGLTMAIMRVMVLSKALFMGWNSYTLDYDTFKKAEALGILPLIERMFDFLYRFRLFKQGFVQGLNEVFTGVTNFFTRLAGAAKGSIFESVFQGVLDFMTALTNNDPSSWERFGSIVGSLAAKAVVLGVAIRPLKNIIMSLVGVFTKSNPVLSLFRGALSKIVGAVRFVITTFNELRAFFSGGMLVPSGITAKIIKVVTTIRSVIGTVTSTIGTVSSTVMGAITGLASAIGVPVAAVVAVIAAAVLSVVAFAITHWDEFKRRTLAVWEVIKSSVGKLLSGLLENVRSIWSNLQTATAPVVEKLGHLKDVFGQLLSSLGNSAPVQAIIGVLSFFGNIITGLAGTIAVGAIPMITNAISFLANMFTTSFNTIVNVVSHAIQGIIDIFSGVFGIISGIISLDGEQILQGFRDIGSGLFEIIIGIGGDLVSGFIQGITNAASAIYNTVKDVFGNVIDYVKGLFGVHSPSTEFDSIGGFCMDGFGQGIEKKKGALSTILGGVKEMALKVFDGISSLVGSAVNKLTGNTGNGFSQQTDSASKSLTQLSSAATSTWTQVLNMTTKSVTTMNTTVAKGFTTMSKSVTTSAKAMSSALSSSFSGMSSSLSNSMSNMRNSVSSGINSIQNMFRNMKIEIPKFQLPHFTVTGSLNLGATPPTVPEIGVKWYAKGGVFEQPNIIGVGEAGKEAVVPLENNTQWIGLLAGQLTDKMTDRLVNARPVANTQNQVSTVNKDERATYVNKTTGGTDSHDLHQDNRVTFEKGSIIVQVMSASETEAERLAEMIMEKIKRKKELEKMRNYSHVHA